MEVQKSLLHFLAQRLGVSCASFLVYNAVDINRIVAKLLPYMNVQLTLRLLYRLWLTWFANHWWTFKPNFSCIDRCKVKLMAANVFIFCIVAKLQYKPDPAKILNTDSLDIAEK